MSTIGEKVAHVRAARQTRSHACHWPGCDRQVAPALWGCRAHWYALPHSLRRRIWLTYRINQENELDPSPEYLEAARDVQRWIAEREAAISNRGG